MCIDIYRESFYLLKLSSSLTTASILDLKLLKAFATVSLLSVEGPQHLLYLLDQILDFVERLCNEPYFRFAAHKIAKRVTIRQAGRPDLLLLHLRNLS
jgi:hypothetical protein